MPLINLPHRPLPRRAHRPRLGFDVHWPSHVGTGGTTSRGGRSGLSPGIAIPVPTPGARLGLAGIRLSFGGFIGTRGFIGAQGTNHLVLGGVGVLVLVDEDVPEAASVMFPHLGELTQQDDRLHDEIVEVACIGVVAATLILRIE